ALVLTAVALPSWTLARTQDIAPQPPPTIPAAAAPADTVVPIQKLTKEQQQKAADLEARIRELQKELAALRGNPVPPAVTPFAAPSANYAAQSYYVPVTTYQDGKAVTSYQLRTVYTPVTGTDEVHLSRVTYKLTADKAKALAGLLSEHVKGI